MAVIKIDLGGPARVLRGLFCKKVKRTVDGKTKVVYKFSWKKTGKAILASWSLIFVLFMVEEAFQNGGPFVVMALNNVQRYDLLEKDVAVMDFIAKTGRILNYMVGWTNPFFFVAYYDYFNKAAPMYIEAVKAIVQDHAGKNEAPILGDTSTFTEPPKVEGAVMWTEAKKWYGFKKTVIVPITSVKKTSKVVIAMTQGDFELVAFPSNKLAYDKLSELQGQWVVATGNIGIYHDYYQVIVNEPSQIITTKPLLK